MTLPPLPDTFHWTNETWGPGLRCAALDGIAPHVFTTRQLKLSDGNAAAELAASVGASQVVMVNQVHGRTVVIVRDDQVPEARLDADALVSNARHAAIVVKAADCVPLLLADRRRPAVAAVHAGWRGTAAGVAVAAVEALAREFGTRAEDLIVAIGPSIGSCCYEVGTELVDAFAAAGHARYLIERWFATPPPRRGAFRPTAGGDAPKLRLDVAGANRDQLILAGVGEENIHLAGLCTADHLDVFTSYRAERENAGRLAGAIRVAG